MIFNKMFYLLVSLFWYFINALTEIYLVTKLSTNWPKLFSTSYLVPSLPYIQSCMFYLAKFGYNLLHTFDKWLKSVNKKDRLDIELEIM